MIRMALEVLAISLATPKIGQETVCILRHLLESISQATRENNLHRRSQLSKEFHLTIYRASQFDKLYQMIVDLWALAENHGSRGIPVQSPELVAESEREHRAILDSVERGDAEAAAQITRQHRQSVIDRALRSSPDNGL
jgi:DNA-binding GntR family transcriptional regulator